MEVHAQSFITLQPLQQSQQSTNENPNVDVADPSVARVGTSRAPSRLVIDTRKSSARNSHVQIDSLPPFMPPLRSTLSLASHASSRGVFALEPSDKMVSFKSSSSSLQPQIATPNSNTSNGTPESPTSVSSDATMVSATPRESPEKVTPYSLGDKELPPSILKRKQWYRNRVRILGLAYSTIYVAAGVISSFLTSIFQAGFYAMACSFTCYGIASLFVPSIAAAVPNLRWLMVMGGSSFLFYLVAVSVGNMPFFLVASCVNGFGIALLWGSQGMYQSKVAEQAGGWAGFYVSQFQTMFALNGLVGNSIAIAIIYSGINIHVLIYVMIGVCCIGVGLLSLVDPLLVPYQATDLAVAMGGDSKLQSPTGAPSSPGGTPVNATVLDRLKMIWDVATHKPGCYLLPWMGLYGYSGLISGGRVPKLVTELLGKELGYRLIPVMMICYAFGATLTSLVSGKWMDRKGWRPLLMIHGCLIATIYALLYFLRYWRDDNNMVKAGTFLCVGFMFGISDNLTSTRFHVAMHRRTDTPFWESMLHHVVVEMHEW